MFHFDVAVPYFIYVLSSAWSHILLTLDTEIDARRCSLYIKLFFDENKCPHIHVIMPHIHDCQTNTYTHIHMNEHKNDSACIRLFFNNKKTHYRSTSDAATLYVTIIRLDPKYSDEHFRNK